MAYKIKLPTLFELQREIANHPARFKVCAMGRRFGKSALCCVLCLKEAIEGKRVYWVAPFTKNIRPAWREVKYIASKIPNIKILETEKRIEFPNGGTIDFKSADNADAMRGEGLDFLVVDEMAFVKKGVWSEVLRPMLSDRQGRAIIISTPKGRGEFYHLFLKGMGNDKDWKSWNAPSNANPYFPGEEFDTAKRELPEDVFRQEYEAMFLDGGAGVFKNIDNCIRPIANSNYRNYVMGVDIAKKKDFTAICILDRKTGELIETHRMNKIDYIHQEQKIINIAKKYKAQVLMDQTGVGERVLESLKRANINIKGYLFTNSSKKDIITDLQLAFEKEKITISPTEKVLIEELKAYEYILSPSGVVGYGNGLGSKHDDMVIALALAWSMCSQALTRGSSAVYLAR